MAKDFAPETDPATEGLGVMPLECSGKGDRAAVTLLIDLGGVLLDVDFERALAALARDLGVARQTLIERIFTSGLKDAHDSGAITSRDFYHAVIPDGRLGFAPFSTDWSDIFVEKHDVIALLLDLGGSCERVVASNTDPLHVAWFRRHYPWFGRFAPLGLSFELRAVKPSADFFSRLLGRVARPASQVIFIDDRAENVAAASRAGISAHRFTTTPALIEVLRHHGLGGQ
jgi:FMN phosphatase YigB (HAD superfamily)